MKKVFRIVAVSLVIITVFSMILTAFAETENYGVVTAKSLYVRSGPNTGYSAVGTVHKNYTFNVTDTEKGPTGITWYKIPYGNSNGWISGKYVRTGTGDAPQQSIQTTYDSATDVYVTGGTVNIRTGPSTDYSRITRVHLGDKLTAIGEDTSNGKKWYCIDLGNGSTGWISGIYISTKNPGSSQPSSDDSGEYIKVTGDPVNIRCYAGTEYSKIGTARKGSTYKLLGSAADSKGTTWYKINFGGHEGWITSKYSKTTSKSNSQDGGNEYSKLDYVPESGKVKVTGSTVNVRQSAGTSYSSIGKASKGKVFSYSRTTTVKGTVWYNIDFNGQSAWISGAYAVPVATAPSEDSTPKSTTASSNATTSTTEQTTPSSTEPSSTAPSQKDDWSSGVDM